MDRASLLRLLVASFGILGSACTAAPESAAGASTAAVEAAVCAPVLAPAPEGSLGAALTAYGASCSQEFELCAATAIRAFHVDGCPARHAPTIEQVASTVMGTLEDHGFYEESGFVTEQPLAEAPVFRSAAGQALLAAIEGYAGGARSARGAAAIVRSYEVELPCPNCHAFATRHVILFPAVAASRTTAARPSLVVVLDTKHGYDG
jgi:hypothetical protein